MASKKEAGFVTRFVASVMRRKWIYAGVLVLGIVGAVVFRDVGFVLFVLGALVIVTIAMVQGAFS